MTGLPPVLDRVIGLSGGVLDTLMPMHLWVGADGRILRVGPTLRKMAGGADPAGRPLFEVIALRRPVGADGCGALARLTGQRLGLVLTTAPELPLRGTVAALPGGAGLILDISLGLSFARAVAEFGLTLSDFSPCDQTVALLYLHEANASTMALSRHLTRRLQAARAEAERQALTDPLTGLANRRAMDARIAAALADPAQEFGLLHVDLDLFKEVNDTHGHAAGDAVLARVGEVMRHQLRETDVAGRVGGDEFLVLMPECTAEEELSAVAARLIATLEQPVLFERRLCMISASIGITSSRAYRRRPGLDALLADADAALYRAKRAGRGCYRLHAAAPAAPAPEPVPPGGHARRRGDGDAMRRAASRNRGGAG
jgi:diguanylate cyclase (GGDEF)-like protein